MINNFALIVLSCDKYSDTWDPFFKSFFSNWKDFSSKIYLVTNEKEIMNRKQIKVIKTGPEYSWSSKVRKAIKEIDEQYVLVMLDDYFLTEEVNNDYFYSIIDLIMKNNIDYISLVPSKTIKNDLTFLNIKRISNKNLYGKTLQPSIWRKDYLLKCLFEDDFSPWEFENRQKMKSDFVINGNDYCVIDNFFQFCNGVLQGDWYPKCIRELKKNSIYVDEKHRDQLNLRKIFKYKFRVLLSKIVPTPIIRKSRKILEKIGFKFITKGEKK